MTYPVRYRVYTFAEIQELDLEDMPCLLIEYGSPMELVPIQLSSITEEEHMALKGWPESKWVFLNTTHERIPVFKAMNSFTMHVLVREEKVDYEVADSESDTWLVPQAEV